jgi:hypothetical protein|tara:strand:- start:918 stop:1259 length:342 start_codon:yes stop_codon:yes gene_type:complete
MSSPPPITGLRQRYPETPMPNHDDDDDDDDDEATLPRHEQPETDRKETRTCENLLFFIFVTVVIAHFWTVWTLQVDVNILMQYQKEHVDQYKHIAKLLEDMHQVKWQMVPAIH